MDRERGCILYEVHVRTGESENERKGESGD